MTEEMRKEYALMRYGIIAPVVCHMLPEGKTKKEFFEDAASKVYTTPDGKPVRFATKTLERWCYFYEENGFDALLKQPRRDKGKSRKIDEDIREQIQYLKESYPRMPATEIHKRLVENGTISPNEISLSTVTRCVNQIVLERDLPVCTDMRRYERPHINEVWCGDTCVGPKITMDGGKRRIYVLALIDDASRYITGAMVFYQDNFNSLLQVMKSAVTKYGVPKIWNFDNGGSFKNRQMELLAARIGSTVHYCHPYTPTQKSKIERWFRTLRDKWLAVTNLTEFSSLSAIQESLDRFVDEYNHSTHSSLNGLTPDDRFFSEPECIRRLSTDDIDKNFLLEVDRRVSADCVITIDNVEYPAVIPGGNATAEAVAYLATEKFVMHSPLYRMEQQFRTSGVPLSRQTMSNWLLKSSELWLEPLWQQMKDRLLQEDILHADETTLQVLNEPGRKAQSKSYMWLYRTGRTAAQQLVLYEYQETRGAEHPETFLRGYKGYLHADGYAGYHKLPKDIRVVGCMAHARRKFDEALNSIPEADRKDSAAERGVRYFDVLFSIEEKLNGMDLTPEERTTRREQMTEKPLAEFHDWVFRLNAAPKSALGKAAHYTREQWPYLVAYLEDGRLEISNNRAERSIKPFVMSRKNFLFANTPNGAKASSIYFSLIETAKENGLDPYRYLTWVLKNAPKLDMKEPAQVDTLLPMNAPEECRAAGRITSQD